MFATVRKKKFQLNVFFSPPTQWSRTRFEIESDLCCPSLDSSYPLFDFPPFLPEHDTSIRPTTVVVPNPIRRPPPFVPEAFVAPKTCSGNPCLSHDRVRVWRSWGGKTIESADRNAHRVTIGYYKINYDCNNRRFSRTDCIGNVWR